MSSMNDSGPQTYACASVGRPRPATTSAVSRPARAPAGSGPLGRRVVDERSAPPGGGRAGRTPRRRRRGSARRGSCGSTTPPACCARSRAGAASPARASARCPAEISSTGSVPSSSTKPPRGAATSILVPAVQERTQARADQPVGLALHADPVVAAVRVARQRVRPHRGRVAGSPHAQAQELPRLERRQRVVPGEPERRHRGRLGDDVRDRERAEARPRRLRRRRRRRRAAQARRRACSGTTRASRGSGPGCPGRSRAAPRRARAGRGARRRRPRSARAVRVGSARSASPAATWPSVRTRR